jgi:hypothetical protein
MERLAESPVPVMASVGPPAAASIVTLSFAPGATGAGSWPVVASIQFEARSQLPDAAAPQTYESPKGVARF